MGSCAAPSAKGDDKFITTDYLQQCLLSHTKSAAWAGATAASSVIATIIGAWVGGGLVDRFG
ncbi:hypothetical protein, partial [Escherichia coli]